MGIEMSLTKGSQFVRRISIRRIGIFYCLLAEPPELSHQVVPGLFRVVDEMDRIEEKLLGIVDMGSCFVSRDAERLLQVACNQVFTCLVPQP